jgi:hypothetical protein
VRCTIGSRGEIQRERKLVIRDDIVVVVVVVAAAVVVLRREWEDNIRMDL